MINTINGLLNETELDFLKKECINFKEDMFQIYSVQNKKHLLENSLNNYISNVNKYIKKIDANFILDDIWINKITENSNLDEKFHYDDADFSIVTYINRDYIGGDLEWIDTYGKIQKITPEENLSILVPKNVYHKVTPVTNGVRYSMALFFKYDVKSKKKLL
jgi:predicted 2-oxoglutarate/Fe(II)-dependent dioxygenase YbiX